jgi:dihydrolipoamide dehydrogenase
MASYDVIIIGSGPGGYVCAIRCAQLGLKTACVEGRDTLGGTCLNVGCIPSKALLHATTAARGRAQLRQDGPEGQGPSVDWKQMLAYKDDTIGQNTKGIEFLFKKNKIDWLKGWGSIPEAGKVKVGDEVHEAKQHRHRHRVRGRPACRVSRSTRRSSSPPPARWNCRRCRRRWW